MTQRNRINFSIFVIFSGDENLFVPTSDAFLLKFLRARKFNAQKAFHMVSFNRLLEFGATFRQFILVTKILCDEATLPGTIPDSAAFGKYSSFSIASTMDATR